MFILGIATDTFGDELLKQQEILGRLADMALFAYAMESAWCRAQKAVINGQSGAKHKDNMANAFIYTTVEKVILAAKEALSNLTAGDELVKMQTNLAMLLQYTPVDTIALRREIAGEISEAGKYVV